MLFLLTSSGSNHIQPNTTKVKAHLTTGIVEIYAQHQDLVGRIVNNVIEIESTIENKTEKLKWVIQEGIFIVSAKNAIAADPLNTDTTIYVYGTRAREINSKLSIEDISKEYEIKKENLQKELQAAAEKGIKVTITPATSDKEKTMIQSTSAYLLNEEVEFLKKVLSVSKEGKS